MLWARRQRSRFPPGCYEERHWRHCAFSASWWLSLGGPPNVCQLPLTKALHRAGGLDSNSNVASILSRFWTPRGSFDVCAFPSLEILLAKGWLLGERHRPSGRLAGNRVMYSAPAEPKSLERDNGGLSRWSWRGDEKDTALQSWPQCLVSVHGPRKHVIRL